MAMIASPVARRTRFVVVWKPGVSRSSQVLHQVGVVAVVMLRPAVEGCNVDVEYYGLIVVPKAILPNARTVCKTSLSKMGECKHPRGESRKVRAPSSPAALALPCLRYH